MFPKNYKLVLLVALVLSGVIVYLYLQEEEYKKTVQYGDVVQFTYKLFDEYGNLLSSSELIENGSVKNNPLVIKINNTGTPFETYISDNVIGMKLGEEKILNIKKELRLFGEENPSLIRKEPRFVDVPMYDYVSKAEFLATSGVKEVLVNRTITTNGGYKITILNETDNGYLYIQYIIQPQQTIKTLLGIDAKLVSLTNDTYKLELMPVLGTPIRDPVKNLNYIISDVDNETYTLNANPLHIINDLKLILKVDNIQKPFSNVVR